MKSAVHVGGGLLVLLLAAGVLSGQDVLPSLVTSESRGFYWEGLPVAKPDPGWASQVTPSAERPSKRMEKRTSDSNPPLFAQAAIAETGGRDGQFEIRPLSAFSNDKFYRWEEHFAVRAGYYAPTGSANDQGDAFFGELDLGTRLGPYADISLQISYLKGDDRTATGKYEARSVPLMLGLTGNLPLGIIEPYAGASVGFAFSSFKFTNNLGISDDKNQTLFAWNVRLGMNLYILEQLYVGLEGRYMATDSTTFQHRSVDLDGVGILLAAAYRF
jgi:opacity protein-like surface antigen